MWGRKLPYQFCLETTDREMAVHSTPEPSARPNSRAGRNINAALEDGLLHHVNPMDKILFQLGVVPRTILCGCIGIVQQIIEVNPDSAPLLLSVVMLCICNLDPQGNQFIVGLLKAV